MLAAVLGCSHDGREAATDSRAWDFDAADDRARGGMGLLAEAEHVVIFGYSCPALDFESASAPGKIRTCDLSLRRRAEGLSERPGFAGLASKSGGFCPAAYTPRYPATPAIWQ